MSRKTVILAELRCFDGRPTVHVLHGSARDTYGRERPSQCVGQAGVLLRSCMHIRTPMLHPPRTQLRTLALSDRPCSVGMDRYRDIDSVGSHWRHSLSVRANLFSHHVLLILFTKL